MNVNKIKELKLSLILSRNFCYKLNEERILDFPKTYSISGVEKYWKDVWQRNNYFNPAKDPSKLRMILPPPNVTGVLHLGHALTATIQDVLARWHRMRGESVLWIPGLDHAGIATQAAVEKYLFATKGLTRMDLGKDQFLSVVEDWKNEKGETIKNQLKSLATTLNWSEEYFTMSNKYNSAVIEAFIILNDRDLLYRKKDLVNWSTALQSTISEIEVEMVEVKNKTALQLPGYDRKITFGEIAEVAFKVKDSNDEIVISTTRVESMLGDVAIAVHPDDSRYSKYIDQQVWHPLRETFIPVIQDQAVKPDFGTGALKITPAHDHTDLEIAQRHNLEVIEVIGEDGKLNSNGKAFEGLPRFIARQKILDELANKGLLRGVKDHPMMIPTCSRSGDVIEYQMREQWFIRMKQMAKRAADAVRNGTLFIDPPRYNELWFDKLDNIRDWCVSRQLWWGHQIPAYSCENQGDVRWIVARNLQEAEGICSKSFGDGFKVKQDTDVLDTWFSAALLPLTALHWPDERYTKSYPLTLMETGHDILFFWVARMSMLCTELSGSQPFDEILLHSMLCDTHGRKMSKSRGNVILPEFAINGISLDELNSKAQDSFNNGFLNKNELKRTITVNNKTFPQGIPECGIDAVRLTLCSHNIRNEKISFNVAECKTNKNFCNKIWQACKYVLLVTNEEDECSAQPAVLYPLDKWILSRLATMVTTVNESFDLRNFHKSVDAFREFFYYEFCDFYLEATKPGLRSDQNDLILSHKFALIECLQVSLRVLAPIMPFLAEELYSRLAKKLPRFQTVPSIFKTPYPMPEEIPHKNQQLEEDFNNILQVVLSIRDGLSHMNKKSMELHIVPETDHSYQLFADNINLILATTRISNVKVFPASKYEIPEGTLSTNESGCNLYYLLSDNDAVTEVKKKIENKRQKAEKNLKEMTKKM